MWSPLYSSPRLYEKLIRVRHRKTFYKRLKLISNLLENKRVVELGCGTGKNGVFLKGNYIGFDLKEKFIKYGKKKKRNVHISDIFDVPLKKYDAILMVDILHHIPQHKKLLKKVTQTKKTVIVCEPFEKVIKNRRIDSAFRRLNKWVDCDGINPPVSWYKKAKLQELFRDFGFSKFYNIGGDIIAYYSGSK